MFEAAEIGLEAFGHNIENRHLIAALDRRAAGAAAASPHRRGGHGHRAGRGRRDDPARRRRHRSARGSSSAPTAASRSAARRPASRPSGANYPQAALTLNLGHARPHNGISTEFHTESGPFTLVPLPGLRSSLVCVVEPAEAEHLGALDAAALSAEIERRAHSILGKVTVEDGRGVFPLAHRDRANVSRAAASRSPAKPRMSSRRSARRG